MPSGEVHGGIGIAVGAAVAWHDAALHPIPGHVVAVAGLVGVGMIGALLPDVDLRQSLLGRYVPWVRTLLVARRWLGSKERIHRGLTHHWRWVPVTGLLVAAIAHHWLALGLSVTLGAAMALAYLSHLVADQPMGFWRQV